jgi:N-acetylmuramoyl-L-alanine amidase
MQINRSFIFLFLTLTGLLTSFDTPGIPMEDNNEFVVVLDAGHGGHDPGNLGNGYLEKNISLNIVLKVGEALSQHPDIKVVYTRKNDTFVDLYVRGEIANKANADLFVSVHCDSHSSDANGAGTFVLGLHANEQNFEIAKKENSVIYLEDNYETRYAEYDINSPESIIGLTIMQEEFLDQSIMLAKMMQDNFTKKLRRNDRKVKQAGFIVLHQTFMPSVLVETGFLTNRSEGGYLNSKKGQTEMGKAIADAIVHYKENIRATVSEATGSQETEVADFPSADQGQEESRESTQDHVATHVAEKDAEIIQPEEKPEQDPPQIKEAVAVEKEMKTPRVVENETLPDTITPGVIHEISSTPEDNTDEISEKQAAEEPEGKQEETAGTPPADKKTSAAISFKVQLLASSRDLPLRPENFKGLNRLSKETYGNLFRYLYGNANSFTDANLLLSNATVKGYKTAFIVAYKDGQRIPVKEALKYLSE